MNAFAFFGAIEIGLVYGFVAFGVYLTFRVLNFPDLTVDGSFPLGGAVVAALLVGGHSPLVANVAAFFAGGVAGFITAALVVRFGILHLLASILTMIAAFSINIRIMGRPNIPLLGVDTIISPFENWGLALLYVRPLFVGALIVIAAWMLIRFLLSDSGLALRATGANQPMAQAQGIHTNFYVYLGLMLSNALVALGGALFSQTNGFADVTSGVGTIVIGLASVILGEALLRSKHMVVIIISCVVGSVLYRLAIAITLSTGVLGLKASDLNLITALLVTLALIVPKIKDKFYQLLSKHDYHKKH